MNCKLKSLLAASISILVLCSCASTSTEKVSDKTGKDKTSPKVEGQAKTASGEKAAESTAVANGSDANSIAQQDNAGQEAEVTDIKGAGNAGAAPQSINLSKLPDKMVIVTVGGAPVTIQDYRVMLSLKRFELDQTISRDPVTRSLLVAEAKKNNISLSDAEKAELKSIAKHNLERGGQKMEAVLKENKVSEAQVDNEIFESGLALKYATAKLEQNILNDLVNRQLLCNAAKSAGLQVKAENKFMQMRKEHNFKHIVEMTGLSENEVKSEIVKSEMAAMMIERIAKKNNGAVSDKAIQEFYSKNKDMFKHGERVRWSQIIIACPAQDIGDLPSIRKQVQKAYPNLKGKELEQAISNASMNQRIKAQEVLVKVTAGEDFAALANKMSDDIATRKGKTGGDMGFQEKAQLEPDFAKAVWGLKPGKVLPQLVQSPVGFHIIKVTAHEPAGSMKVSEVRGAIQKALGVQQENLALTEWLAGKRAVTPIAFSKEFQNIVASAKPAVKTN
jgi:hypothetical protein